MSGQIVRSNSFSEHADAVFLLGDSSETLKGVPDKSVKLVITSPPYNLNKSYEVKNDLDDYLSLVQPVINECNRVLRDDGSLVWQVGNYVNKGEVFPLDILFYPIFKSLGLKLRNRVVWTFGHGLHCTKRLSGRYETFLWFTKSDDYTFNLDPIRVPSKYPNKRHFKPGPKYGTLSGNPLGKNPSDVWEIVKRDWESLIWDIPNVKQNHPEKLSHPCQFPIELVERCVLSMTNEGDTVLDPYAGVGSSLLGALMHGRRGIVCERDESYMDLARLRVDQLESGDLPYRELGKPIPKP